MREKALIVVLLLVSLTTGVSGILAAQKKPAAPVTAPCPPTQVQQWPNGVDPSLDWTRALNNLHSRLDQLEKKIDARPLVDPEIEDLHRRLLAKPFPVYEGAISGKRVVMTPK